MRHQSCSEAALNQVSTCCLRTFTHLVPSSRGDGGASEHTALERQMELASSPSSAP